MYFSWFFLCRKQQPLLPIANGAMDWSVLMDVHWTTLNQRSCNTNFKSHSCCWAKWVFLQNVGHLPTNMMINFLIPNMSNHEMNISSLTILFKRYSFLISIHCNELIQCLIIYRKNSPVSIFVFVWAVVVMFHKSMPSVKPSQRLSLHTTRNVSANFRGFIRIAFVYIFLSTRIETRCLIWVSTIIRK